MLQDTRRGFSIGTCYCRGGFGYLKKNIKHFNNAAKGTPFLVLTDLDQAECAPAMIKVWISCSLHSNLIFRVAVREVEAWVMAHRKAFADFLSIQEKMISCHPDDLNDPKQEIIKLAKKSRKRELREAIVPAQGSTSSIGPDYNGKMIDFIRKRWVVSEAAKCSPSLKKTFVAIKKFQPNYKTN